jgi:hypothetical protein
MKDLHMKFKKKKKKTFKKKTNYLKFNSRISRDKNHFKFNKFCSNGLKIKNYKCAIFSLSKVF